MDQFPHVVQKAAHSDPGRPLSDVRVVAVMVTYNRPDMLSRCVDAVARQVRPPDQLLIVDNASEPPAAVSLPGGPPLTILRPNSNLGPAGGFGVGIRAALDEGADYVWLMDDDGMPATADCLSRLLAAAEAERAAIISPLVVDIERNDRLAFPLRHQGRTRFRAAELSHAPYVRGFAHLFNGALIAAHAFAIAGLPDQRLVIRGDEVDFMFSVRRAGLTILTCCTTRFLHPGSTHEIHPILGGLFYAVIPADPLKRAYQFRNRGWIFSRHGMWGWLFADHVRYAWWYVLHARDPAGYLQWIRLTWRGVFGRLGPIRQARARGMQVINEAVL